MTLTINLPQDVEYAYLTEARSKGISIDSLVQDVLVSHAPGADSLRHPELVEEFGISVLRTGQPLDPKVVSETLDAIRRERDLSALGQR